MRLLYGDGCGIQKRKTLIQGIACEYLMKKNLDARKEHRSNEAVGAGQENEELGQNGNRTKVGGAPSAIKTRGDADAKHSRGGTKNVRRFQSS